MASTRFFRYLAPNVITLSSMIFGLVSLWSSAHNNTPLAAWMIIYAVLTDRLDGLVARAVKGAEAATDWHVALERDDVDLVVIGTRHDSHAEIAAAALRAGKAVFASISV